MTDPNMVENIYRSVIDDTITKLAPEFENAGVSLQALARLQEVWTSAMVNMIRSPSIEPQTSFVGNQGSVSGAPRGGSLVSGTKGVAGRGGSVEEAKEPFKRVYGFSSASSSSQLATRSDSPSVMQVDDPLRYTKDEKGGTVTSLPLSSSPLNIGESNGNGGVDHNLAVGSNDMQGKEGGMGLPGNVNGGQSLAGQILQNDGTNEYGATEGGRGEGGMEEGQYSGLKPNLASTSDIGKGIVEKEGEEGSSVLQVAGGASLREVNGVVGESNILDVNPAPIPSSSTVAPSSTSNVLSSDSESSEVSDEEEVDTSGWTNSLMSLYEEPTKRTKNKRTYKLVKGILNVDGKDYLFKGGKAEFDWK